MNALTEMWRGLGSLDLFISASKAHLDQVTPSNRHASTLAKGLASPARYRPSRRNRRIESRSMTKRMGRNK